MRTVRWGIIGPGDVAEKKGGPALYRAAGSSLNAVCSRDLARAQDFIARHGDGTATAYDNLDAFLADPSLDAVYIATPPVAHCAQTIACAKAGKHVLVEKPMAMDSRECDEMIAACREHGVHLHVAYYRRLYPKFVALKERLDSGAIGTLLGARLLLCNRSGTGGWRVAPEISGGGHFVDVGSHRLDMLQHLLGEVTAYDGFASNRLGLHAAENDVVVSLQFASGAVGSGEFHFHTTPGQDLLEVYGSEGTAFCNPFDGQSFTLRSHGKDDRIETFETPSPSHLPFVEALVRVYNGESIAHVTGEAGAQTTRIMERALLNRRDS